MALTVKAYFTEGNDPQVIKRFSVDADFMTSFEYLRRKIIQSFPNLNGRNFSTYWHDKEGDQIIFSSDDELMQALSQVDEGVLKIYIKIFPRTNSSHSQFNPFTHGSTTFPSGLPFMAFPMTGTPLGFPFMLPAKDRVHLGVTCDGCSGDVVGMRFKCQQCPDYDLCVTCKHKEFHKEHTFFEIPLPVNELQEMLKHFAAQLAANVELYKETNNMQHNEYLKTNLGNQSVNFHDHLKNVEKCVEAMLQPLGINFSIDVNAPPNAQPVTEVSKEATCGQMTSCDKIESCNKEINDKKVCCRKTEYNIGNVNLYKNEACNKLISSNKGNSKNNVEIINAKLPLCEKSIGKNTCNKLHHQSGCKLQQEERLTEDLCAVTYEPIKPSAYISPANNDWVEIDEIIFSKEEENLNCMDKKINDSVLRMKRMGFNDEDGWLTALITTTKGDVNKALDLIHAKP